MDQDTGRTIQKPLAPATSGLWAGGPEELVRAMKAEREERALAARVLAVRTDEEKVAAEEARLKVTDGEREVESYEPSDEEIATSLF